MVASIMFFTAGHDNDVPSIIIPIAVLSLFTVSAAAMGAIFFYQPFRLYFDGAKEQAVRLAWQSIVAFAALTLIFIGVLVFASVS